uniref:Uncharacterized protein n=1 Tax=Aegilops tauschii subsp. strangulata TaxID=200361 RepID=A0A452Z0S0_AEGTS
MTCTLQRISANEALDSEYFWTDPLPCDPKSLPKYEASHEYQTKKRRQQQRQADDAAAKRQKTHHSQPPHARLPPIQQSGHQIRPAQPTNNPHPPMASGSNHHYGKPRGPGGPNRYPPGGNQGGGGYPNRGGQGGGYGSGPYPPQQGRGPPPYPGGGPRGGGSSGGYGGAPNFPQAGPYGPGGPGRGPNYPPQAGSRNQQQQYGNWQ